MHNCLRHMVPTASVPRRPGSARAERGALPSWPVPAATWQKCTEGASSRKEKSQMWLRSSGETLQKEKTCVPSFVIRLCKHVRSCFILLEKKKKTKNQQKSRCRSLVQPLIGQTNRNGFGQGLGILLAAEDTALLAAVGGGADEGRREGQERGVSSLVAPVQVELQG